MSRHPLRRAALTWAIAGSLAAGSAMAAWHDEHPGSDIRAHHVHLSGYGGDNARNRALLEETYRACAETNPRFGRPVEALPAAGLPATVSSHEIDIYYAAGRTLTVSTGTLQTLDRANCRITPHPYAWMKIQSGRGVCSIDLIRRRAQGLCLTPPGEAAAPAVDLAKVPAHLRAEVSRQIARLDRGAPAAPPAGAALPATGSRRVVAGHACTVYRQTTLDMTLCIARPDSRFPIGAAPLNGATPGLLLASETPALTLSASSVALDVEMSESAFAIPADVQHGASGP